MCIRDRGITKDGRWLLVDKLKEIEDGSWRESRVNAIISCLLYTSGHKHVSIGALPDMKERTIVINGFSKAFAMTG